MSNFCKISDRSSVLLSLRQLNAFLDVGRCLEVSGSPSNSWLSRRRVIFLRAIADLTVPLCSRLSCSANEKKAGANVRLEFCRDILNNSWNSFYSAQKCTPAVVRLSRVRSFWTFVRSRRDRRRPQLAMEQSTVAPERCWNIYFERNFNPLQFSALLACTRTQL